MPAITPPIAVLNAKFLLAHPAHFIALGLGSGLSPKAPGTVGTLWAWLAWLIMQPWLSPLAGGVVIVLATLLVAGVLYTREFKSEVLSLLQE